MIGKLIYSTLTQNAAVNDIINGRVYPEQASQGGELPAVVYSVQDREKFQPSGMNEFNDYIIEINFFGRDYLQLDDLENAIINALENEPINPEGHQVEAAHLEDRADDYEDEFNIYTRQLIYKIQTHKI